MEEAALSPCIWERQQLNTQGYAYTSDITLPMHNSIQNDFPNKQLTTEGLVQNNAFFNNILFK